MDSPDAPMLPKRCCGLQRQIPRIGDRQTTPLAAQLGLQNIRKYGSIPSDCGRRSENQPKYRTARYIAVKALEMQPTGSCRQLFCIRARASSASDLIQYRVRMISRTLDTSGN